MNSGIMTRSLPYCFDTARTNHRITHVDAVSHFIKRYNFQNSALELLAQLLAEIRKCPSLTLTIVLSHAYESFRDQLTQGCVTYAPVTPKTVSSNRPGSSMAADFRRQIWLTPQWKGITCADDSLAVGIDQY